MEKLKQTMQIMDKQMKNLAAKRCKYQSKPSNPKKREKNPKKKREKIPKKNCSPYFSRWLKPSTSRGYEVEIPREQFMQEPSGRQLSDIAGQPQQRSPRGQC